MRAMIRHKRSSRATSARLGLALGLFAGLTVMATARTQAQPSPADPPEADVAAPEDAASAREARELFREGHAHFEAGEYEEAVRAFERAAERVPSADIWYNIARSYEELHDYPQAVEYYRRYLRDRVDPPDLERIETHISNLEAHIEEARLAAQNAPETGRLEVRSAPEGATVTVDDAELGTTPMAVALTLAPGGHSLLVEREGYIPHRSEVNIAPGMMTLADVGLEPLTSYRAVRGRRIFTWIVGAVAVAAFGTSLGLGIYSRRLQNDGNFDRSRDFARYSDFALAGGVVLSVGAVVLYFAEGRAVGTERVEVE